MHIFLKYTLAWFPMLAIAIINGIIRDVGYKQHTSDLAAHQISTFSLIALFAIYVGYVVKYLPPTSAPQALLLGLMWMFMTLIFEFGFGRYRGHSWQYLLNDYNIFQGRLWALIPIWVAIAPYVFFKLNK